MKVLFSLIMILILSAHAISGQTESAFHYFNRVYVADTMNMFSLASSIVEDGYLITGTFSSPSTNGNAVYLRKINLIGEDKWFKIVDNDHIYGMITARSMIQEDDYVYLTYATNPQDDELNLDMVLLKCDLEGNVIWRKTYGENDLREAPHQIITTSDNGFFITGLSQISTQPSSYYCIKTDSLGNEEWSNTYQLDGNSVAFYGYQTWDGGYIMSGYGFDEESDYDMYIVKIDQEGNVEWEQNYGSTQTDTGGQIKIVGNQYLIMGAQSDYSNNYFYYLNIDGSLVYEKEFYWSEIDSWSYSSINALLLENYIMGITTSFNELNNAQPIFALFDENGDSIWTKNYTLDPNQRFLIIDLDPTPDGGYLLTGFHDTPAPQYSWVAKVDSLFNGCVGMSCDSSVTIIDTTTSILSLLPNISFSIHPNPIKDQGLIHYRLPMEEPYAILRLFDLKGNECQEKHLHTYQQEAVLDVSELAAGLYTYVVDLGKQRVAQGKLMVE